MMKRILLTLFAGLALSSVHGEFTLQIIALPETGLFVQADGSALPEGSIARVGYFDEAALTKLDRSQLSDFARMNPLFTEVARFSAQSGQFQEYLSLSVAEAGGTSKRLYLWVFNGIEPAGASQSGIFGDPGWTVPFDFGTLNLVSSAIEGAGIFLGRIFTGGGFALEETVGEPVGRDLETLFEASKNPDGSYTSSWFGTFSYLGAGWIHDSARSSLYVDAASSREDLFLYSLSLASWLWTSRDAYPVIFAYGAGTWFHVLEVNGEAYLFDYETGNWQL